MFTSYNAGCRGVFPCETRATWTDLEALGASFEGVVNIGPSFRADKEFEARATTRMESLRAARKRPSGSPTFGPAECPRTFGRRYARDIAAPT